MEWISLAIAVVVNLAVHIAYYRRFTHGTLKIDHSNPEKDVYRFELDNLDDISKKSRIVLKIDHNAKLSQK